MATQGYSGYKGHDKIGADAIRGIQGVKGVAGTKGVRASIWHNNIEYEWDSDLNEYVHWVRKGNASIPMKLSEVKAKEKATAKAEGKNSPKHVKVPRAAFRRAMINLAKDYQHAQKKFEKTGDKRYAETAERIKDAMLKSFALVNIAKEDKKKQKEESNEKNDSQEQEDLTPDYLKDIVEENDRNETAPKFIYNGLTDSPEDLEKYKEHLKTLTDDELDNETPNLSNRWYELQLNWAQENKGNFPEDVYKELWGKYNVLLYDSMNKFYTLARSEAHEREKLGKWTAEASSSTPYIKIGYDYVMTDDEIEDYLEPIFSSPKTTSESLEPLKGMYADKAFKAFKEWEKQNKADIDDSEEYEFKKKIVLNELEDARKRFYNAVEKQQLTLTELSKISFAHHGFPPTKEGIQDYKEFLKTVPASEFENEEKNISKSFDKELAAWKKNASTYLSATEISDFFQNVVSSKYKQNEHKFMVALGEELLNRETAVKNALTGIHSGRLECSDKGIAEYKEYLTWQTESNLDINASQIAREAARLQLQFNYSNFLTSAPSALQDEYKQIAHDIISQYCDQYGKAVEAEKAARAKKNKKAGVKQKVIPFMPDVSFFPTDISEVEETDETLGGSTGAKLVKDANGNHYIMKRGNSPEHIVNEGFADAFYQAAGVKVPAFKMYDDNGTPVKLSTQLKNVTGLDDWWKNATEEQREEMRGKIRKDVAVDILMGNWDFIGDWDKNILIDEEGTPWRIDNGCSMGFRGQGGKKDRASWGEMFDDLFTMTGNSESIGNYIQSTIPTWLGKMRPLDIAKEINSRDWSEALKVFDQGDENRAVVEKRLEEARQLAERGEENEMYGRTEESTDELLAFSYQLCKDGLREALPKKIDLDENNYILGWKKAVGWLYHGNTTETLNGKTYGSLGEYLADKMGEEEYNAITTVDEQQGIGSYTAMSVARKLCVLKSQGFDCLDAKYKNFEEFYDDVRNHTDYYCGLDYSSQKDAFRKMFDDARQDPLDFERSCHVITQWDAVIQLTLENIEQEGVDRDNRTIFLCRTEDASIICDETGNRGVKPGERTFHRVGVCESHSHICPVAYLGTEITSLDVPWSRCHGIWYIQPGEIQNGVYTPKDDSAFKHTTENEVSVDSHGLPKVYVGKYDSSNPMKIKEVHKIHDDWKVQHPDEIV